MAFVLKNVKQQVKINEYMGCELWCIYMLGCMVR